MGKIGVASSGGPSPAEIAAIRRQLTEAANLSARSPTTLEVTLLLPTAVGETREAALAIVRPGVAL